MRARMAAGVIVMLCLLLAPGLALAQRQRGITMTEQRVALVIGNAAYRSGALDNPIHDARLIASSLERAGFSVALRENLDRRSLIDALREFGGRLNDNTIAVLYYAGHGLQLRDHNYLIPVDADIHSEDEIAVAGLDLSFILNRMSHARSRINIVILDACRNNPFAGKTVSAPSGLAPMDAPVGTLLAFATAPGKLAADSEGGVNSPYASYLAKFMLTPGLPVEQVFKRVREGVVRDTKEQQVPWESSSLQGEFAFVPGTAPATDGAQLAAGELAFWNSVQASNRPEEYRAYLHQYPQGRFAALAHTRVAELEARAEPATRPEPAAVAASGLVGRPDMLPRVGDSWRYRVQDQFRLGDLFVTARVDEITPEGIAETWSTTADAKVRTTLSPYAPGFDVLPGWTLAPPEFAPYLQAFERLRPGQAFATLKRRVGDIEVPLEVSVEGEEEVAVAAGRFRATKIVLQGQTRSGSRGTSRDGQVKVEQVVWYAPQVKRIVKSTVRTQVGSTVREAASFELMEYRLN